MRFYCNINANPRALVKAFGSDIAIPSAEFKRRDAGGVELQLFSGDGVAAAPYKLADAFELRFKAQASGDYGGAAVVFSNAFAWRPTDQVYRGSPSFGGLALSAMFGGATKARRYATGHTLVADDLGGSVTIVSSVAGTVVVPLALGSGAEKIWIIAADDDIVITAGSGVTLTTSVSATVAGGTMVMIERTALNAWTVKAAAVNGVTTITLEGEFTWRDLAAPDDWTSTETFEVIVNNDVNQGNESEPIDVEAPTIYATKEELATGYVRTDIDQTLDDTAKQKARTNIGALGAGEAVSYADQDPTTEQATQARDNIGAASKAEHDALATTVTALSTTVAGKAAASALSTTNANVTALDAVAIKKTVQTLSAGEQAIARANIGAAAASGSKRYAMKWSANGNQTTGSAEGCVPTPQGTATARPVSVVFPLYTFTAATTDILTATGHPFANGNQVMVETTAVLPAPLVANTWYWVRDVSGATFKLAAASGGAAIDISSIGSGTHRIGKASTTIAPQMRRVGYVSAATAGSSCGVRNAAQQFQVSSNSASGQWTFSARFLASDAVAVTAARTFIGMANTAAVIGNVNPSTLLHIIGVGADSGDANLSIMHNDGSGTATKVDMGAGFPAHSLSADAYELTLTVASNGASVAYSLKNLCTGNTASGTISTDLPAAEKLLAPQLWRANGATALAVALDVMQFAVETLN